MLFTFASLALLGLARFAWPRGLADPRAWAAAGQKYLAGHIAVVSFTLGLEVALACALALAAGQFLARGEHAVIGGKFDAAVVRGEHIAYMLVRYQNDQGQFYRRKTTQWPCGKLAATDRGSG